MGRRTSVYLTGEDLERVRALGFPPLGEVLRAGLAVLEASGPAQGSNDSQCCDGGPAQTTSDNHAGYGGPAQLPYDS
jgi:hypothetical protein